MWSADSELVLIVGIKKSGKTAIQKRLQQFFPQIFQQGTNILNLEIKKGGLKSFPFKNIALAEFQHVTIPIFVVNYNDKKLHLQQEFFNKFDDILAEHHPETPLLICLHKQDEFVDPVQRKEIREKCSKCFRRKPGRKSLLVATSTKDYSIKRALTKMIKLRAKVRPPPRIQKETTSSQVPIAPSPITKTRHPHIVPPASIIPPPQPAHVEPEIMPSQPKEAVEEEPIGPPTPKPAPSSKPKSEPEVSPESIPEKKKTMPKAEKLPFGGLSEIGTQIKSAMKDADLGTQPLSSIKKSKLKDKSPNVVKETPIPPPVQTPEPHPAQIKPPAPVKHQKRGVKSTLSSAEFLDLLTQELDSTTPEPEAEPEAEAAMDLLSEEEVMDSPFIDVINEIKTQLPDPVDSTESEPLDLPIESVVSDETEVINQPINPENAEEVSKEKITADSELQSIEISDMNEIIEWSEQVGYDGSLEEIEEFNKAMALIDFLENIKLDFELQCIGLFDLASQEEILITTGVSSLQNPQEIHQAFLNSIKQAESLNPKQISGKIRTAPNFVITVRKITPQIAAVFLYNQDNKTEITGASEQIRTFLTVPSV